MSLASSGDILGVEEARMAYKTELLRRLKALKEINERTRAEIQREESAQSLLSQRFNDDPEVQALHEECTAVQAQAGRLREAKEVLEKNSGAGSCGLKLYTDVDGRQCYSFKPLLMHSFITPNCTLFVPCLHFVC